MSPNVPDITEVARAAESAGTGALTISNTMPALHIDVDTHRPALDNGHVAEYLMAGASAVQIGTAGLFDPVAPFRILAELEALLALWRIDSPADVTGKVG